MKLNNFKTQNPIRSRYQIHDHILINIDQIVWNNIHSPLWDFVSKCMRLNKFNSIYLKLNLNLNNNLKLNIQSLIINQINLTNNPLLPTFPHYDYT